MVGLASGEDLEQKRALIEILRQLLAEIPELEAEAALMMSDKQMPTVTDWFNREIQQMESGDNGDDRNLKQASISRIKQVYQDWLKYLGGLPLNLAKAAINRVGPEEVNGFLAHYKSEGFSGTSRKFAMARIRAAFGHAVDKGLISVNPASAKQVGPLRFEANSIRQAFNPNQVKPILAACDASAIKWIKLSALLGLYTGQRASDICAMKWEDIRDLDNPLPVIHLRQQKIGNALVIPIAENLRKALQSVPGEKRSGHLLPVDVAGKYTDGRKRTFQRPWRDLLDDVKLAELTTARLPRRLKAMAAAAPATLGASIPGATPPLRT